MNDAGNIQIYHERCLKYEKNKVTLNTHQECGS